MNIKFATKKDPPIQLTYHNGTHQTFNATKESLNKKILFKTIFRSMLCP